MRGIYREGLREGDRKRKTERKGQREEERREVGMQGEGDEGVRRERERVIEERGREKVKEAGERRDWGR